MTLVPRLVAPTVEQFQSFARQGRPVILCGVVNTWRCHSLWTEDYLAERLSGRQFLVTTSASGAFGLHSSRIRDRDPHVQVTLPELFDRMRSAAERRDSVVYYMQQKTIQESLPELVDDIEWPAFFDRSSIRDVNLWLSQRGSHIPLHFDTFDNLLAQIRGSKSIVLHSPNQSSLLYPGRDGAEFASQVDVHEPNFVRFPLFREAQVDAEFVLEEGELLYLPAFWWHHVVTSTQVSLSIITSSTDARGSRLWRSAICGILARIM